jgi:hypothetical protein
MTEQQDRGLLRELVGDGVPMLVASAAALIFAGGFALFLAASGEFLPHDMRYLGMTAGDLCSVAQCRVVDFMIHDRAAFGGSLVGIGLLYLYLALFPLRRGEAWAWWLFVVTGVAGFLSFLSYLGYGYLDSWHGIGTLLLLPVFAIGVLKTRRLVTPWRGPLSLLTAGRRPDIRTRAGLGRAAMVLSAGGVAVAGLVIYSIGVSHVFVPEDLEFMRASPDDLNAVNPRLIPLIAHDRVGFGGAVFTLGLLTLVTVWCSAQTRALWETLALAGTVALGGAFLPHIIIGYTNLWHLAPVAAGAGSLVIGLTLTWPWPAARDGRSGVPLEPVTAVDKG